MDTIEKRRLKTEIEMQSVALRKINIWKIIAIAVSTFGVAITYAGFAGTSRNLFIGVLGIVIIFIGLFSALIFNLGLKNGRKNVEKMINILEKENKL